MAKPPASARAPWWRSWRTASWGDWVGLAARLILGGVLLVAGALKVNNLAANVLTVKAYQLVSPGAAEIIGYLQPPLEILLGLALILGVFTRFSAAVAVLTMLIFIFGISWVWAKGLNIDCGCFGDGGQVEAGQTQYALDILRDIGLALLGVWLMIRPRSKWSVDGWLRGEDLDSDPEPEPTVSKSNRTAKSSKTGSRSGR